MDKKAKKVIFGLVILSTLIIFQITAYAYTILPGYWTWPEPNSLHYYYIQQGNISYNDMIVVSISKWNIAAQVCATSSNNDTDFYIYSKDYGNTSWAGKCYYPCLVNSLIQKKIQINQYHLGTDGYYTINVTLHELGHMYGLDHSTQASSVMKSIADPSVLDPNSDDINGVNSIY